MDLYGYRRIWFDVGTANESLTPIILSAGDHDGRIVAVRLWDGPTSVSGSGLVARLLFNDNTGGSGGYSQMTAVSGEATAAWEVAVPTEALTPGHSTMAIEISQGQTVVCSRLIDAFIEPAVIDGDAPEAQDALAEFRAAVARLEDFTVPVPVGNGGTGKTSHTSNAVLTGNGSGNVKNVATASGALYATSANGAASFGTLPIAQGGTGQTTVAAARNALGLGNTSGALPVANGGTGSTSAADARTALGVTPANIGAVKVGGDTMTGHLTLSGREIQPKSANLTNNETITTAKDGSGAVDFLDSAGTIIGMIRPTFGTDGQWVDMFARRPTANGVKIHRLKIGQDSSGNALVSLEGTGAKSAWRGALGLDTTTKLSGSNAITISETNVEAGTWSCYIAKSGDGTVVTVSLAFKPKINFAVGTNYDLGTLPASLKPYGAAVNATPGSYTVDRAWVTTGGVIRYGPGAARNAGASLNLSVTYVVA